MGGRWGRMVAICLGLFLFLWILRQVGLEETLHQVRQVGWSFFPLLLPSLLMIILFSLGWWWTLPRPLPFLSLFLIRAAGEAVNTITPLAYLGGEPLKASLLQRLGISLTDGLASVVVTKTALTFTYCLFIFFGLAIALLGAWNSPPALVGGAGAGLFLAISVLILYYSQRRGLFSILHRLIYWLGVRGEAWMAKREVLEILDTKIVTLYRSSRALSGCLLFSLLGWLTSPLETYLFLWALGTPVDLLTAIVIQALVVGVKAATFFIPASLGAQEGGNLLIFLGLGMSGGTAMAFSLLRRAREVVWIIIGLMVLSRFGWRRLEASPKMERGS
ncbi:MAG: flippase-like domain-containing protein [Candidatus Methylomirabilales bacterium]